MRLGAQHHPPSAHFGNHLSFHNQSSWQQSISCCTTFFSTRTVRHRRYPTIYINHVSTLGLLRSFSRTLQQNREYRFLSRMTQQLHLHYSAGLLLPFGGLLSRGLPHLVHLFLHVLDLPFQLTKEQPRRCCFVCVETTLANFDSNEVAAVSRIQQWMWEVLRPMSYLSFSLTWRGRFLYFFL